MPPRQSREVSLLRKQQIGSRRGDNRRSTSAADSDDSSLKNAVRRSNLERTRASV
jgi:hypothetical protein